MCTYATVTTDIEGSAKGPGGKWFAYRAERITSLYASSDRVTRGVG